MVLALDSHAHCARATPTFPNAALSMERGEIAGGVLFSPVGRRNLPPLRPEILLTISTIGSPGRGVHHYLESLISERLFAFWFV